MIYEAFEAQASLFELMRPLSASMASALRLPWPGIIPRTTALAAARLNAFTDIKITTRRPPFGIAPVMVGNAFVKVLEEPVLTTPFVTMLRFRKQLCMPQPKLLVVAPMSGHFATLLRATVQTLLIDHDVYIMDWHNIRDVPREAGPFDLSTYVSEIRACLTALGEGAHLLAVCQPTVPALAAVALMAEDKDPALPRSLILMAGPIDARLNPTSVNKLANEKPIGWFERTLITTVPAWYKGFGRRVYPGFIQLAAFISMNPDRHKGAMADMVKAQVDGDHTKHATIKAFYDEYLAVMDLSADFYLQTVQAVFQEYQLATGTLEIGGRRVDPRAIRRVALLTIEGERDDICGLGQTMAALDLCSSVPQGRKVHHVQTGVGHYGVFSGRRWVGEIYPHVRDMIALAS
jgi:polyhydroxyalkanoate depolymerase